MANTPFPLGIFAGGANGSDSNAEAGVDARFDSFTNLMGAKPAFVNAFINQSKPIDNWPSDVSWTAWSYAQSPAYHNLTPVIGLPMATEGDRGNPGQAFREFASGRYDNAIRGMVKAWTDQGFHDLYVRPGWEMNVSGMPWYVGDNPQTQSDYVAAFKHIADVLHSAPNASVKTIWNPNIQNWNGSLDVRSLYPGNQYVDQIGGDIYSDLYPYDLYNWGKNDGSFSGSLQEWASDPANLDHYWNYPDATKYSPAGDGVGHSLSLQNLIDFAKSQGKPFAIPETGAGGNGAHGPRDNGAFPTWLAGKLASTGVNVSMVNVWNLDAGDGDWTFAGPGANRPQEAGAWAKGFGANGGNGGGSVPNQAIQPDTSLVVPATDNTVTPSGDTQTLVVHLSEDMFQGDAQFSLTFDGKSLGGAQTVTAIHGNGESQAFSFTGQAGAGPHDLGITFLNDAWGGTPDTDRNLYVDKVELGGNQLGSAQVTLYSEGTKHLQLPSS